MGASSHRKVHSRTGSELVRLLAREGDRIFNSERARELAPEAGVSDGYLRQALHHLVRSGWLVRLRKGLYAIAPAVPGLTPAHEFEIAMHLTRPAAIAFWSAMHHHAMTEQVPSETFVLTTTDSSVPRVRSATMRAGRKGVRSIGGADYRFVQVKPERFFGSSKVWVNESRVLVTNPERTLLDGLMMPKHCGDFAEVLSAFATHVEKINLPRIVAYALKLDTAVAMRLGWALEHVGVHSKKLRRLRRKSVRGYRPLDPTGPRKGRCDGRWMVQVNLPGRIT